MSLQDFPPSEEGQSLFIKTFKDSPVTWYNFGKRALEMAKNLDRPILLSIGHTSSHLCKMMANEVYQDQKTAQYINENFIPILVDRDEYPDLDQYFQLACQIFGHNGGWPLTLFTTCELRPFFLGTYFPLKAQDSQAPGFFELLQEITRSFKEERQKVEEQANKIEEEVLNSFKTQEKIEYPGHFPPPMAVLEAIKDLEDKQNGGYGAAPKFPLFAFYEWAIEQILDGTVDQEKGQHIVFSSERMLMGGIHDFIRGGFHRYCADDKWHIPQFEKVLYDQAGLLSFASKLSLVYPSPLVYDCLFNTIEYLEKEMLSDKKYFFCAQDPDSEGVPGLYYTFTIEEFEDSLRGNEENDLTEKDKLLKSWFGIEEKGNYHSGLNVIKLSPDKAQDIFSQDGWTTVRHARRSLWLQRQERIPPQTDTKGICSWNFLTLGALLDVVQYCRIPAIRIKAMNLFKSSLEGCYQTFLKRDSLDKFRLIHTTGNESIPPYFEDYVFFAECLLKTYQITTEEVFKTNLEETLKLIFDNYYNGEHFTSRPVKDEDNFNIVPNLHASVQDIGIKSPLCTLMGILRQASLICKKPEYMEYFLKHQEEVTQKILRNPLASGEGLRTMTYPQEAYRLIRLPRAWAEKEEFQEFIPYFTPRFVFAYHDESEGWEICKEDTCELKGTTLEEFIKTLTPSNEQTLNQE